jgi:hypothetical protein
VNAVLARFATEQALNHAVTRLAAAEFDRIETYTPTALQEQSDPGGSPLPLLMFIAGTLGFIGFFLLMSYADLRGYPLNIGGRPKFAWPAFIPIAFELGVLCAMGAGFLGYFWVCRMPQLYDPVDNTGAAKSATRDGWLVAVHCADARHLSAAHSLLAALEPDSLEEFAE